jgi:hypothetical protein
MEYCNKIKLLDVAIFGVLDPNFWISQILKMMELLRLLDGDEGIHEKAPHAWFDPIQFIAKFGHLGGCCTRRTTAATAAPHFAAFLGC